MLRAPPRQNMDFQGWWTTVPFFNKFLIVVPCLTYIFSWVAMSVIGYLINTPVTTINSLHLWTLFTSFLTHYNILQLLFSLLSLIPTTILIENMIGTVALACDVMIKGVIVQILYTIICYIFYLLGFSSFAFFFSSGLWTLVMVYLSIRCFTSPEEQTPFLCFPVMIKQKYYPFLLILLFGWLSGGQVIDLLIAVLWGYFEYKYYNGMFVRLSLIMAQKLENSFIFKKFGTRTDFVFSQAQSQYFNWDAQNASQQQQQQQQQQQNQQQGGGGGSFSNSLSSFFGGGGNNNQNADQQDVRAFSGQGVQIGSDHPAGNQQINAPQNQQRQLPRIPQEQYQSQFNQQQQQQGPAANIKPFSGRGVQIGGSPDIENVFEQGSSNNNNNYHQQNQNYGANQNQNQKKDYQSLQNTSDDKKDSQNQQQSLI